MKRNIDAVIFDADGTVLDTRELVYQAYQHVFGEHGYQMPPMNELARFGGRPTEESYAHFATNHDSIALRDKHHVFQAKHLDLFAAYEGLDELMSALKRNGIKIGICTNRASSVIALLKHIGIHDYFDAIIHADLVSTFKPDPEGLLMLCEKLGVEASRAVMVGDTDADIGAGKAAGCAFTIGITHGLGSRETLINAGANHVIGHLDDVLPLLV